MHPRAVDSVALLRSCTLASPPALSPTTRVGSLTHRCTFSIQSIDAAGNAWLVKGYGEDELKSHADLAAARKAAEGSNPSGLVTPVLDQQGIQTFLTKAYQNVKISVILFHNKVRVRVRVLMRLVGWRSGRGLCS
jgi:hypothetical protein